MISITYILFSLTSRVSVFCNTALVLVRTINVVFPTHKVSRALVMWVLITGNLLWLALGTADLLGLHGITPFFEAVRLDGLNYSTRYDVLIDSLVVSPLTGFFMFYYIFDKLCLVRHFQDIRWLFCLVKGVPFVLPAGISVICMVVQVYFLLGRSRIGRHSVVSRRITVTVLYLTTVFVLCNVPDFILNLILMGAIHISHIKDNLVVYMCTQLVSSVILPFLNSLLNPFILMTRGSSLRSSIMEVVPCGVGGSMRLRRASALETLSREQIELNRLQKRSCKSVKRREGQMGGPRMAYVEHVKLWRSGVAKKGN